MFMVFRVFMYSLYAIILSPPMYIISVCVAMYPLNLALYTFLLHLYKGASELLEDAKEYRGVLVASIDDPNIIVDCRGGVRLFKGIRLTGDGRRLNIPSIDDLERLIDKLAKEDVSGLKTTFYRIILLAKELARLRGGMSTHIGDMREETKIYIQYAHLWARRGEHMEELNRLVDGKLPEYPGVGQDEAIRRLIELSNLLNLAYLIVRE